MFDISFIYTAIKEKEFDKLLLGEGKYKIGTPSDRDYDPKQQDYGKLVTLINRFNDYYLNRGHDLGMSDYFQEHIRRFLDSDDPNRISSAIACVDYEFIHEQRNPNNNINFNFTDLREKINGTLNRHNDKANDPEWINVRDWYNDLQYHMKDYNIGGKSIDI